MRLRRAGDAFTLTVKNGHGQRRRETEAELDRESFVRLWPATEGRRVEKDREKIGLGGGLVAELDRYTGSLEGISVVEVEFENDAAADAFTPPGWFGRELTGDPAWANQSLARHGRPEKALEFRLRAGEDAAAGVCRVITARAAQAAAAVRRAGEATNPAGDVHEARKSLKKARSALRLLGGVIGDEERREANASCRDAAARLSGPRDAEVKLETLESVVGDDPGPAGAVGWRSALEREAAIHRGDLTPAGLAEAAGAIEAVARRFRGRELPEAGEAIAGNAARAYRRGRRAMKRAGKSGRPAEFHQWRKRAKDLRYQLEILETRLPDRLARTRRQAEELADQLGDLHDLDVLADDLATRELWSLDRERLGRLVSEARDRRIESCLELGENVYEEYDVIMT